MNTGTGPDDIDDAMTDKPTSVLSPLPSFYMTGVRPSYDPPEHYAPVHVPSARKAALRADRSKATRKAQKGIASERRAVAARLTEDAPACAMALGLSPFLGPIDHVAVRAELLAMPSSLDRALRLYVAHYGKAYFVDAEGTRRKANASAIDRLVSALPRQCWHLATKTTEGARIDLARMARNVMRNLSRQDRRQGGEVFAVPLTEGERKERKATRERIERAREARRSSVIGGGIRSRTAIARALPAGIVLSLKEAVARGDALIPAERKALARLRKLAFEMAAD